MRAQLWLTMHIKQVNVFFVSGWDGSGVLITLEASHFLNILQADWRRCRIRCKVRSIQPRKLGHEPRTPVFFVGRGRGVVIKRYLGVRLVCRGLWSVIILCKLFCRLFKLLQTWLQLYQISRLQSTRASRLQPTQTSRPVLLTFSASLYHRETLNPLEAYLRTGIHSLEDGMMVNLFSHLQITSQNFQLSFF